MPTTSAIPLTQGAGDFEVAIYTFVESAITKALQRVVMNAADGSDATGAQGTGVTYNPPTGGSGLLGYLSAIMAASLDTTAQAVTVSGVNGREYETVAASQSDQALGATGATGDDLDGVLIVPATTSPGAVSVKDGGGSAITIFTGGATSVSNLVPFFVPLGLRSLAGAWKVTTGANVSAIGIGNFT